MARYAHITGWGMATPKKVLSNFELEKIVETSNEWIVSRTGIQERRIASEIETPASLAVQAALRALEVANVHPSQVDLIIVATSSPEHIFPATACIVQDQIGAKRAGAFDLSAACTGFIYALEVASSIIRSGAADTIVVIGTETLSRFVDWQDRNTCILFGDGAGAFVLQASEEPGGILAGVLRSDGSGAELLTLPSGAGRYPFGQTIVQNGQPYIRMNGREVFRFATRVMAQSTLEVVQKAKLTLQEVGWIVPHQANQRIIETAAKNLNLPVDKFISNIHRYGNTSTASIPIATCEAIQEGKLKPGDYVVFVGFGAGLTWGATLVRWGGPFTTKRKRIFGRRHRWLSRLRSRFLRWWRRIEGFLWGKNAA
ncbi:MAG: beta-ketoacyl-ACP synthase III [Anaerolineales bacterium]|nr:beta-ketoacyl-ACP synthase III [Anaerolineales bacterium]